MKTNLNLFIEVVICMLLMQYICVEVNAQNVKKVHGKAEYVIYENDNITHFEARHNCIKLAQEEAIKKEFGELVSSITNMIDSNINGEEIEQFISETNLLSKAIWLEDTKEPIITCVPKEDGRIIYTAEVWGMAKEISRNQIELEWKILAGGIEDRFESNKFSNKQRIYIKFSSPIDGYLAIYLLDNTRKVANCLLPYKNNKRGQHYIKGGKTYYLFNKQSDPNAFHYRMTTTAQIERDRVVLIFSPNPFTKCNEITGDRRHPNSLSIDDFRTWIRRLQSRDDDLIIDQSKYITITK